MSRGKRASFGSITRQDKDVWRLRWWADTPEGRRRVSETVHGSRRDAEHRLAEIHVEVGAERGGCPTLSYVFDKLWWPTVEPTRATATVTLYSQAWRLYIKDRWANVPCDQIKYPDVQMWLLGLRTSAAKTSMTVLKQVMDCAVRMEYAPRNVFKDRYVYPEAGRKYSKEVWDARRVAEFWHNHVRGTDIEAAYILVAVGGTRPGEALSPLVGEIERMSTPEGDVAVFEVRRTVHCTGRVGDPKTKNSRRAVMVPEPWCTRLLALHDAAAGRGDTWLSDDGTGSPMKLNRLEYVWTHLVDESGIEHIPLKNLRNSRATQLVWDSGMTIEQVSKIIRNNPATASRYYDRPRDLEMAKAIAAAAKNGNWDI